MSQLKVGPDEQPPGEAESLPVQTQFKPDQAQDNYISPRRRHPLRVMSKPRPPDLSQTALQQLVEQLWSEDVNK